MTNAKDAKVSITARNIEVILPSVNKAQAHNSKLPDDLLPTLYEMRGKGMTIGEIVSWLKSEKDISITISALSRRFRHLNKLNQAVGQAIYLKSAVESAEGVIAMIDDMTISLHNQYVQLVEEGRTYDAKAIADTLFKYLGKKIDMVELGQKKDAPKEDEPVAGIEEILSRISSSYLSLPPSPEKPSDE